MLVNEPIRSPRTLRILAVVERSADERLVRELLGGLRAELAFVPRLELAQEALSRRAYDVLLLDLAQPEQATLAGLRASAFALRLPIVVMIGHEDEDFALQVLQTGIQDCLVKGGTASEELVRALRRAAARHRLVTELRRGHLAPRGQGFYDPLTGLASRSSFLRRVEQALLSSRHYGESPAVLYLALDGSVAVFERLGRVVGGCLLQEVGRRLSWCVRRSDLVGRLGDDRFAVLLRNVAERRAVRAVAERVRLAIAAPVEIDTWTVTVSASIGTATFPDEGGTAEELLASAEGTMLEARRMGGNRCHFFRSLAEPEWPAAEPAMGRRLPLA